MAWYVALPSHRFASATSRGTWERVGAGSPRRAGPDPGAARWCSEMHGALGISSFVRFVRSIKRFYTGRLTDFQNICSHFGSRLHAGVTFPFADLAPVRSY